MPFDELRARGGKLRVRGKDASYPAGVTDPQPGLRIGFVPGVTLTKWRRIWGERFPKIRLELVEVAQPDQRPALVEGRVDMCFVRLPVDPDQLHLIPLYEEVPVVVVAKDHPVSLFEEVSLADLSEENVLDDVDPADAFDLVAGGAGVIVVPHSIARSHSRRDLVYRPVSDAAPTRIALGWPADGASELVEDFIGIVRGRTVNSSRTPKAPPAVKATPKADPPRRPPSGRRGARPVARHRRG